ncbi:hypothetical protein U2F26_30380 [Micromonospora sp. 4G57]|uniref:Uncharacterized protein n=1 Tax=Micromonospora sicca TaxID=2202420 RepID=A0ABU5JM47_9ACTN|nr:MULTISPECIES: hypothetical protein [unclassified Micromonospora]MDZ5446979.1 hypothetical protein [Micromonospora sp. 4G57]MDZ5493656.1 hypothetical protein [Micromonospora sp. 4G53]
MRSSSSGIVVSGRPGTGRASNASGAGSEVRSSNAFSAVVSAVSAVLVWVVVAMVLSLRRKRFALREGRDLDWDSRT